MKRKIFELNKNKQGIMKDRLNKLPNPEKPQRSRFKITTCERFQKVNNDTLQELYQVIQTIWHHITEYTAEPLLVQFKYLIEPSGKNTKSEISQCILGSIQ